MRRLSAVPFKADVLQQISDNPIGFRNTISDEEVSKALRSIGVLPKVLELHAPPKGLESVGLGKTLCGINGTRHLRVTCQRCLKRRTALPKMGMTSIGND